MLNQDEYRKLWEMLASQSFGRIRRWVYMCMYSATLSRWRSLPSQVRVSMPSASRNLVLWPTCNSAYMQQCNCLRRSQLRSLDDEVTFVYDEVWRLTIALAIPCSSQGLGVRYRHHCFHTLLGLLPTFASWLHVRLKKRLHEHQ